MKIDFLKKIFSPPTFLVMPSAGVDINNKNIRYLEFRERMNEVVPSKYGEISLASGIVKDGVILNREELVKVLSSLKEKINSDFVRVSVPEEKTYIFNTEIPNMKDGEIRQALEFRLEENVPLKVDEAMFEYEALEKKDDSENIPVAVSVVPKQTIESYASVFKDAGLSLVSIELESRMVSKSVINRGDKGTIMIVNIKDDCTVLSIVVGGVVWFTSTVSVGANTLLDGVSRIGKFSDEEYSRLPEKLIKNSEENGAEIAYSLFNVFSVIKDEIEKFNEYWSKEVQKTRMGHSGRLDKIVLCGKCSALPGLAGHIGQNLKAEIVVADVWQNAFSIEDFLPDLNFLDSLDYASVVGLALSSKK
jgi:type IV pilus assembly protein PilM